MRTHTTRPYVPAAPGYPTPPLPPVPRCPVLPFSHLRLEPPQAKAASGKLDETEPTFKGAARCHYVVGLMREVGAGTDKSEISAVKNYKEVGRGGVG